MGEHADIQFPLAVLGIAAVAVQLPGGKAHRGCQIQHIVQRRVHPPAKGLARLGLPVDRADADQLLHGADQIVFFL